MKYLISRFAVFIILLAVLPLQAQELLRVEELLGFLPEGEYLNIYHVDMARLEQLDINERMIKYLRRQKLRVPSGQSSMDVALVPYQFLNNIISYTRAERAKIVISPNANNIAGKAEGNSREGKKTASPASTGPMKSTMFIGEPGDKDRMMVQNRGERIHIFTYDDAAERLSTAVEAGELEPLETGADKQTTIYGYRSSRQRRQEYSSYMALAPTGELLVAESPDMVGRMLAAGTGMALSIRDQREYDDLFRQLPDLGFYFGFRTYLPQIRAMIAIDREREIDRIDADRLQEGLEEGQQWEIKTYVVGDDVVINRQMECFGSSSAAEARIEFWKQRPSARQGWIKSISLQDSESAKKMIEDHVANASLTFELSDMARQKTQYRIDGTMLIIDSTIDAEYLDLNDRAAKQRSEYHKRRRAEAAKNKAETEKK